MTKQSRAVLKSYFETGKCPTGAQFCELIESTINQVDDNLYIADNNGDVRIGIGTKNPSAPLEVNGQLCATSIKLPEGAQDGYILTTDENGVASWQPAPEGNGNGNDNGGGNDNGNTGSPDEDWEFINGNTYSDTIRRTGMVGIGPNATNPNDQLEVDGNIDMTGTLKVQERVSFKHTPNTGLLAIGNLAGISTDISNSVYIGYAAGQNAGDTANDNVFIGVSAGRDASPTAGRCVFIGARAGINNSSSQNTAVGWGSGTGEMSGTFNAMYGTQSGSGLTTGKQNTFIGAGAGRVLSSTDWNTFIGSGSGGQAQTAASSTFVGFESGLGSGSNNNGQQNTFLGVRSGWTNTEGEYNTFTGSYAGSGNKIGNSNVYVGRRAGEANQTGSNNVFIGDYAGAAGRETSGSVFIGYNAAWDEKESNRLYIHNNRTQNTPLIYGRFDEGVVAINTTQPDKEVNLYVNGNIGSSGTFWTASDQRYKQDIQPITNALDSVNALNGVTYAYKQEEHEHTFLPKTRTYGLIGQEVQAVLPKLVKSNDAGFLSVNYNGLIPVLINAIQELSAEVEGLKGKA